MRFRVSFHVERRWFQKFLKETVKYTISARVARRARMEQNGSRRPAGLTFVIHFGPGVVPHGCSAREEVYSIRTRGVLAHTVLRCWRLCMKRDSQSSRPSTSRGGVHSHADKPSGILRNKLVRSHPVPSCPHSGHVSLYSSPVCSNNCKSVLRFTTRGA